MSILSSCKLASEAMMKNTRIPICMPTVAIAATQPNLLLVTKYEYTEFLPILLKAYSSSLRFCSIAGVELIPRFLFLSIMYKTSTSMQQTMKKHEKRTAANVP